MQNRKYKASVLAVTLIVMGIVLATALTISAVSVRERKGSIGEGKSSQAYQIADMGVEHILKILIAENEATPDKKISDIVFDGCASCNGGLIVCSDDNYEVQLKKEDPTDPDKTTEAECNDSVSEIVRIKSVGTVPGQSQRAVEAAVPAPIL